MNYGLTWTVLGSSALVPLSDTEYQVIKTAISGLLEYSSIEEKFDLIRENHLELEMAFMEANIHHMLQSEQDHRWFQEQRRLNRRLMNFLASARAYTDHVPQHERSQHKGASGAPEVGVAPLGGAQLDITPRLGR